MKLVVNKEKVERRNKQHAEEHKKKFVTYIKDLSYKYGTYQVFYDFCQCATCALLPPVDKNEQTEEIYRQTLSKYHDPSEVAMTFASMLAEMVMYLELNPFFDFLGSVYMDLGISCKESGQCFTPVHVSKLCSELSFSKSVVDEAIEKQGFVSVNDCCVGGGSMLLSFAKTLKENGINPQVYMCAVCNDIDQLCVNMSFIQFSLSGIPAAVFLGDTMTQKFHKVYHTIMWYGVNHFKFERFLKNAV